MVTLIATPGMRDPVYTTNKKAANQDSPNKHGEYLTWLDDFFKQSKEEAFKQLTIQPSTPMNRDAEVTRLGPVAWTVGTMAKLSQEEDHKSNALLKVIPGAIDQLIYFYSDEPLMRDRVQYLPQLVNWLTDGKTSTKGFKLGASASPAQIHLFTEAYLATKDAWHSMIQSIPDNRLTKGNVFALLGPGTPQQNIAIALLVTQNFPNINLVQVIDSRNEVQLKPVKFDGKLLPDITSNQALLEKLQDTLVELELSKQDKVTSTLAERLNISDRVRSFEEKLYSEAIVQSKKEAAELGIKFTHEYFATFVGNTRQAAIKRIDQLGLREKLDKK
jgi:hypothetical protein